jgi:transposase
VRGDEPTNHAVCAGEDRGATSGANAGRDARPADPPAHPADQCDSRYAAEFGLIAARGVDKIEPLLARLQFEPTLPALARELFVWHVKEYTELQTELTAIEAKLIAWHRHNEPSRRLAKIPGIGPIGASLLVVKVAQPEAFRSGRHFAAWIGLTPKDHSTAGKTRLGAITRAGDEALRSVLVVGATAVIQQVRRGKACPWQGTGGHPSQWLAELLKRKSPKLAAVALANKACPGAGRGWPASPGS